MNCGRAEPRCGSRLADAADALFGHAVGSAEGGDALTRADLEDAAEVVVDGAHHAHGAFAVVAVDLERDVHQATGVHRIVRRVEDAALFDLDADLIVRQLVVGRAADDLALESRQGGRVYRATQRGRRIHITVDVVDLIEAHRLAAELVHGALHGGLVDVGDEDLGALLAQQLDELDADMADALHGVAVLAHLFIAELHVQRGHQALHGAVGGERRGVARAAMHWCTPVTNSVSRNTYSMSLTSMPTSSAVM